MKPMQVLGRRQRAQGACHECGYTSGWNKALDLLPPALWLGRLEPRLTEQSSDLCSTLYPAPTGLTISRTLTGVSSWKTILATLRTIKEPLDGMN